MKLKMNFTLLLTVNVNYRNIRVKYLNPFYYVRPSMFKFISLLKSVCTMFVLVK